MTEKILEYCDSRGTRIAVDREAGVIRGVKILGLRSRNGREYSTEALRDAAPLYENVKVNVNHPKSSATSARDYQDRIGTMRAVRLIEAEGLFADFHFNPKHAIAEQLIWDAEHASENVGFSHNVEARIMRRGDKAIVEAITLVKSVDLVADPATTRGLFESESSVSFEETIQEKDIKIAELSERIVQLEAERQNTRRRETIRRLLKEHCLPDLDAEDAVSKAILSKRFLRQIEEARDESQLLELIADRVAIIEELQENIGGALNENRNWRPMAKASSEWTAEPNDAKSFADAITK